VVHLYITEYRPLTWLDRVNPNQVAALSAKLWNLEESNSYKIIYSGVLKMG
jgi:hypothetical protein